MKVAVRKLQVEDAAKLQMLVAENIDAIEPGLVVLDSRLLLGHATIDVVGLDVNGALVLIATGLTANEEMLLKAVEAYSWCREYPQSLERLYPTCVISDERPPRLVFVVERVPDAFHRKIKQLGFPEVDCVEFRLLDVEGAPAVYFESILRLRRPVVTPAATPRAETPADAPAVAENVIAMNGPVAARATSLKLQKLLNQAAAESPHSAPRAAERPVTMSREPAPVVSIVSRQPAPSAPRVERSQLEPVTLREAAPVIAVAPVIAATPIVDAAPAVVHQPEPVLVPGPIIVTPEPVIATPEPVVVAPAPIIVTPEPIVLPRAAVEPQPAAAEPDADLVDQMQRALAALEPEPTTIEPDLIDEPPLAIELTLELVAEPEPVIEPTPEPVVVAEPVLVVEPALELVAEPEPVVEPTLELVSEAAPVLAIEPTLELVVEPEPVVAAIETEPSAVVASEPVAVSSAPVIPAHDGADKNGVPPLSGERISLRNLPELSLRPSAPIAMPRPAPIPAPAPIATPPVAAPAVAAKTRAETEEPRVSFKDLAAALLGPAPVQATPGPTVIAPAVRKPVTPMRVPEPAPVAPNEVIALAVAETPAEVVVEPVRPAMAHAVAELEPALTVEALIKSTPAETPVAPAAPEAPKPAVSLPLEFAGLQFPKDGVMTRQWMEFLSQMSTTK